jgi:carboxylesterase type B
LLWFVFGVTTEGIGPSKAEEPLVDLVGELWASFARTGDPRHGWPRYTAERDEHFTIDFPSSVGARLDREACDFWDALPR